MWRRGGWLVLLAALSSASFAGCPVPEQVSAVPPATGQEISVATQNLWRLTEKEMTGTRQQQRLAAWSRHIREVLQLPHILVLQEVDTLAMLSALAEQISNDGGPRYRPLLLEGNDQSGIDVAMLYRPPVRIGAVRALFSTEQRSGSWLFSRPPLHVEVLEPFAFELLALHLRSGHGLNKAAEQGRVRDKRRAQAQRVRDWSLSRLAQGKALMLIGDFNSAVGTDPYAEPLAILDQPPFSSAWQSIPAEQRFSYIYRCRRQAIDHILLSPALQARVTRAEASRGNAGRYRALNGDQGAGEVVSDHDALLVYLKR